MHVVGIICEYNPFHKGHIHHINEAKKMFPDSPLILVLNGYFLERGEVSIISKENKTLLALIYGVELSNSPLSMVLKVPIYLPMPRLKFLAI